MGMQSVPPAPDSLTVATGAACRVHGRRAMQGRVTRLPPRSEGRGRERDLAEMEVLAWLLDNSIPIPIIGRRIGLDAIVGFVPGVGDVVSGGLGVFVVVRGAMLGLPRVVLARMTANVAIDFVVGVVPVLGDAFDLWFKSNQRNVTLARRYIAEPDASTRGEWLFLLAIMAVLLLVMVGALWIVAQVIGFLFTEI
jgi:hypothetical protein